MLYRDRTEHQDLVIFESLDWGRVLALDGVVQTTTGDEFCYHEMLVHVPVMAHGTAREVLIIGGGDGGCLREALKHPDVRRVTQVEIDASVIELSKRYLPTLSDGAFDDPRAFFAEDQGVYIVTISDAALSDFLAAGEAADVRVQPIGRTCGSRLLFELADQDDPTSLSGILAWLRDEAIAESQPVAAHEGSRIDALLREYAEWLREERGLAVSTIDSYRGYAGRFLANVCGVRFGCDTIRLASCPAGSVLDSTYCLPLAPVAGAAFTTGVPLSPHSRT